MPNNLSITQFLAIIISPYLVGVGFYFFVNQVYEPTRHRALKAELGQTEAKQKTLIADLQTANEKIETLESMRGHFQAKLQRANELIDDLSGTTRNLEAKLGQTEADLSQTQAKRETLVADLHTAKEKINALANTREQLQKKLKASTEVIADLNDTARDFKATLGRAETKRQTLIDGLRSANEKIEALKMPLDEAQRKVRTIEPNAFQSCGAQESSSVKLIAELKSALQRGIVTPSYDIQSLRDEQMIVDRVGRYYAVTLKHTPPNGDAPEPFYYADAKYALTSADLVFVNSFNRLFDEVISKIDGHVTYELFVRGGADERKMRLPPSTVGHEEFSVVRYLSIKQPGAASYLNSFKEQRLGKVLRNTELPNLRAAYIARLIRGRLAQQPRGGSCFEPTVLEGVPKGPPRNISPELFLFIK